MSSVINSLEDITTGYAIFEKDQVLTHDQLNSVSGYFDDHTRLTRVKLLGVGIVCGFDVRFVNNRVTIGEGAAITTDGDLLYFAQDRVFDQFKRYDETNPKYAPLYTGETMLTVYELVAQGTQDALAFPLTQFAAQTNNASLDTMSALLLMENYVKDDDLCTSTDCDNLGKDCVNTIRVLLIDRTRTAALLEAINTPAQAAAALTPLFAERPALSSDIANYAALAQAYRGACNATNARLVAELQKIYPALSFILQKKFPADPSAGWVTQLNTFNAQFANADTGIQYYYDFLKNIVETGSALHELLWRENTVCCPDLDGFPKHVLLGDLVPGSTAGNRTGFYPSPLVSHNGEIAHIQFLMQKLDALINGFALPSLADAPIRLTPSAFEEVELEHRAIPYYFPVSNEKPLHRFWNYRLHSRNQDAYNYSYHAAAYNAQGGAANPFGAQIGALPFIRIEGHLGKNASTAEAEIERQIVARNLPIAVRSILLDIDRTKIIRRPGIFYTDLHRFHYLLRQDLSNHLDDVVEFSGNFKSQVNAATNVLAGSTNGDDNVDIKAIAEQKHAVIAEKTTAVRAKLNRSYVDYAGDSQSWQNDFSSTLSAAAEFKYNIGNVVKTEFNTPFDSVISTTHSRWLDWLDKIIKDRDDKRDDKLLFAQYVTENPGIEHCGGALRGGTFLLVYDNSGTVVADFMLPYRDAEKPETQPDEPPLVKPGVKPGWVLDNGIRIIPSRSKFVLDHFTAFDTQLSAKINDKLDTQKGYFSVFQDTVKLMGSTATTVTGSKNTIGPKFTDGVLDLMATEVENKRQQVEHWQTLANDTTLPQDKRDLYAQQSKEAQVELANSINKTTDYISKSGANVATGTDGFNAMQQISGTLDFVKDAGAKQALNTGLDNARANTGSAGLKVIIGNMIAL